MAEVATGVLHNVGNVLNSVNVSGNLIVDRIRHSRVADLVRVSALVHEHMECFAEFVAGDPRGQLLPSLLDALTTQLVAEHGEITSEIEQIATRIGHIKDIVSIQQSHARGSGNIEPRELTALVEDALKLNDPPLRRAGVHISRRYGERLPPAQVDGHRTLQILVNLIRNAVDSIESAKPENPRIEVSISSDPEGRKLVLSVEDNGSGIAPEHRERIFIHGFTTKKRGHGFGLHSAAIAATEMGGHLAVKSEGQNRGATFILTVPAAAHQTEDQSFWREAAAHSAA
jgi:two-component system, LuxR family, sensor kinase FixL